MKWYFKASLQKFLSIIPYGKELNFIAQKRLGGLRKLNVHGIIKQMPEFFNPLTQRFGTLSGLKITEIGTGWNPVLPIALSLAGAECMTFDVSRNLRKDLLISSFTKMADHLKALSEMSACPLEKIKERYDTAFQQTEFDRLLEVVGLHYSAPIDTRRLPIETNSQDAVVSRLVLQHIEPYILPEVLKELYRIVGNNGIFIHTVNLHDEHAAVDRKVSLVNFLKYPGWFWDNFGNTSIKYVNRSRYPYYLKLFQDTGFRVLTLSKKLDHNSFNILSKMKIAEEFRHHSREELATIGFVAILEKALPSDKL
jgi:SAM-dependent methyltransferase